MQRAMVERRQLPVTPVEPLRQGGDDDVRRPNVPRPDTRRLLERMRQSTRSAKRYRQRAE